VSEIPGYRPEVVGSIVDSLDDVNVTTSASDMDDPFVASRLQRGAPHAARIPRLREVHPGILSSAGPRHQRHDSLSSTARYPALPSAEPFR
jgi:hypothetical protein